MRTTYVLFVISVFYVSVIHAAILKPGPRYGFLDLIQSVNHIVQDTIDIVFGETEDDQDLVTSYDDAILNITQLGQKYGYPVEEHSVTTDDGYVIDIHRIRHTKDVTNNLVVFLMHGFVESSDSWLLQGPGKALAYVLADNGFDVWMGNARGNKHAQKHVILDPKQKDFWEFTWEEIGLHDLPTMIDYVLNVTNKENLYFIGYSQGTTSFYVMNSLKPEYNEKIKMMFALAPVAFMSHVRSPLIKMFSPATNLLGNFLVNYDLPNTDFLTSMTDTFCSKIGFACKNMLHSIVGQDSNLLTKSLPIILGHMPTTSSTLQLVHYGQLVRSGRFCQFDFGEEKNRETYGTESPPDYNLTKVTVPNVVFFGENDWVADPADVETLISHLPHIHDSNFIKGFNHLDIIYADTANDLVYSKILKYISDLEVTTN